MAKVLLKIGALISIKIVCTRDLSDDNIKCDFWILFVLGTNYFIKTKIL